MLKYLERNFGERATKGDKGNLMHMRNEVTRLEVLVEQQKEKTAGSSNDVRNDDRGSEDQTEESVSYIN